MPELEYSIDALNVRNAFFGAKVIIYVEGVDDVNFWKSIFSEITDEKIEIEDAGGAAEIEKYIKKIENGELCAIAARDADFVIFKSLKSSDPKVVYTRGYSIENSLYVTNAIVSMTQLWSKTAEDLASICDAWLKSFAYSFSRLVHFDVANACSDSSHSILGDNCSRFMENEKSDVPSSVKIDDLCRAISAQISDVNLQAAIAAVGNQPNDILLSIRGHFLESAIRKFIIMKARGLGRSVCISRESLYTAAMGHFLNSIKQEHPHRDYYIRIAQDAWNAVIN